MKPKKFAKHMMNCLIQAQLSKNEHITVKQTDIFTSQKGETFVRFEYKSNIITLVQSEFDITVNMRSATNIDGEPKEEMIGTSFIESGLEDIHKYLKQIWNLTGLSC